MTVATHQKPSRKRFIILTLISLATLINYLDRSVMGVAKPALVAELHITPAVMGLIFSAFSWTYAIAQIPGGYVIDRLGTRLTYALSLGLWSAMTAVHGLMTGVVGLVSSRLALGLAEAPCFPANSRVLSTWFPQQERARATGVYTVGEYIGLGLLIPCWAGCWRHGAGARCSSPSARWASSSRWSSTASIASRARAAPTRPR
jgi:ACS family D-galactonate transporter-like MFS transporter